MANATPTNTITFTGAQLNELGQLWGGRTFRTPDDILKSVRDIFTLSVSGIECQLDVEDLQAFKDQYASFKHLPYDKYVALSIGEAVAQDFLPDVVGDNAVRSPGVSQKLRRHYRTLGVCGNDSDQKSPSAAGHVYLEV